MNDFNSLGVVSFKRFSIDRTIRFRENSSQLTSDDNIRVAESNERLIHAINFLAQWSQDRFC